MRKYLSPQAKVLAGSSIGFCFIDRLSTIFVKNAQKIDWHMHDETEILCCLKGSLTYEFKNRPPLTLTAGCFMVIPIGVEHRLVGGIDGPCRRFSFFIRELNARKSGTAPVSTVEMRILLALLLKKRFRPHIIQESALLQISHLANILEASQAPSPVERLYARSDSLSVLITLASDPKKTDIHNETRLMNEAIEWLKSHASELVSIDQLIAYMGYSRSRFFTLFKSHTGQSPIEWLTRFRIETAQALLRTTKSSINDIAKSCGFSDPAFFARTFRRRVGYSPTEFRHSAISNDPSSSD